MVRPVILVSLDWIRPGDPRTGLGTASIASALRRAGVEVELVADAVNGPTFESERFIERVHAAVGSAGRDVLVGIGAFVWCEPEVQQVVAALQGRATIVLGGPQISYARGGELEALYPSVHYFVRGHGEGAMVALATARGRNGEHGLHIAGQRDRGARADVDLASLPSPHLDGTLPIGPFVRWETQRGCPFRCTFCQHRESGARLQRGEYGAERLHAEMAAFRVAGARRIAVLDPIFHASRRRAAELLMAARATGLRAELSLQCRFELIDDAFLDAITGLNVMLEFGLQTIHESEGRAVARINDMSRVANVIDRLHQRQIPFEVSLIYGLPTQTLQSFRESLWWCIDHGVPRVRAWPLMLLRGTQLHAQRDRWGYVESADRIPVVVESSTFSREDHAAMARLAARIETGVSPIPRVA